jgi:secreted Zn-dependent insulinase-like peptidase
LKTLFEIPENNGKNPYIEAKKFYRAKYSANRLSIVIYTHEDLKKRVTELLFEYF